jgi:16S rRNA (guanine527-N7)-methyltransferase
LSDRFSDRFLERALRAGLHPPPSLTSALERYWSMLDRWNQKINLTALPLQGFPSQSVDRLLIEPLLAADLVPDSPVVWYDLGSGGGSPAIPLKLARPRGELTMVEARERKAAFLREVVRNLEIEGAGVEARRFEELVPARPVAGLITVRAVRLDRAAMAVCARLLEPSGRLLLFAKDRPALQSSSIRWARTVDFSVINSSVHIGVPVPRGTS